MEISNNFERYKELLRSTNREGVEDLIKFLESSDFEVAPASTKYHGNVKGGLCAHSLEVYEVMSKIIDALGETEIKKDSIIITALCHDLAKVNYYEETFRNKKEYSPNGSKHDEGGNYDWVSEKCYKVRDLEDRFVYSNHEATSEFITRQFIPLSIEESVAILHHHGSLGYDSLPSEVTGPIFARNPLAIYLHSADSICAHRFI